jgi:hypothetical protein
LLLLAGGAGVTAFLFQESLPWLNQRLTSNLFEAGRPAGQEEPEQKQERRTPYLSIQDLKAAINQPVELGVVLNHGTGGEILVLSGFSEGTKFSAGAALGATRWSLPGIDADKTFISAPENFSGTMLITVTLYSSRQEILETKAARFEWSGSVKGDKLPVTISPDRRLSQ